MSIVPRDFHRARYYFLRIARQVWPRDLPNPRQPDRPPKEDIPIQPGYAALAAGYIGRMCLRGEGVKQDPVCEDVVRARCRLQGKESHNGLGINWRDGLVDGKKDLKQAMAHFAAAATQELAEAQVDLGKYHYGKCKVARIRKHGADVDAERSDLKLATAYFETALRQVSPFEAYNFLADIQARHARSKMIPPAIAGSSCAIAVSFYKLVAERSTWEDDLLRDADTARSLGPEPWNREGERDGHAETVDGS